MRELIYYIAASIDGYIAGPNGEVDAFPIEGDHMNVVLGDYADALPSHVAAALAIEQDLTLFDTVLMGWNTYRVGESVGILSPYAHLRQFVFSRSERERVDGVEITAENPRAVAQRLKAETTGSSIWLCGGGELAGTLVDEIDRVIVKVNPVLLGAGIPLFAGAAFAPETLRLERSRVFESGVVINEYVR
jgi:dihydrofolate reductase